MRTKRMSKNGAPFTAAASKHTDRANEHNRNYNVPSRYGPLYNSIDNITLDDKGASKSSTTKMREFDDDDESENICNIQLWTFYLWIRLLCDISEFVCVCVCVCLSFHSHAVFSGRRQVLAATHGEREHSIIVADKVLLRALLFCVALRRTERVWRRRALAMWRLHLVSMEQWAK